MKYRTPSVVMHVNRDANFHQSLVASLSILLAPIVLAVSHTSASPVPAGDVVLTLQLSLQCHVDSISKHHPVSQSIFSSLHEPDSFSSFSHGTQSSVLEVRSLLADKSVRTWPMQPYIIFVFHRFSIFFAILFTVVFSSSVSEEYLIGMGGKLK